MAVAEGPTTVGPGTGEYVAEVKRRVEDKGSGRQAAGRQQKDSLFF